ncbi:MAG TPA: TaqI-like C-terminal specificity domain-containing protein [Candidatus Lokiarchaeia archaeon]|nr:TaqI-like C-terminal specificity domain-containing protein [Candidatus Lokiarchaeia archaeon]
MGGKGFKNDDDHSMDARKLSGSFYSPKNLVQFMCQACLELYLSSVITIPREDIDQIVVQHGVNGIPRTVEDQFTEIDALLSNIHIIDPAAGNGVFLEGMLDEIVMLRQLLNPYFPKARSNDRLAKDAALNSLHGVDIDPAAIQDARSLLDQACSSSDEDEAKSMHDAISRNLVHGDALKDAIYLDARSDRNEDWKSHFSAVFEQNGGFDIVISNPPYLSYYSNTRSRLSPEERQHVKQSFKSVLKPNDRINAMNLFIEKGIDLLKPGGVLSYVVNKTVSVLPSYEPIRKFLLDHVVLDYIFTDLDFFDAVVDCMVLQLQKSAPPTNYQLQWCSLRGESLENESLTTFFSRLSDAVRIAEFKKHRKLEFNHSRHEATLEKIEQSPLKLRDIVTINRGVNIGGCSEHFLAAEKIDARYEKIILDANYIGRYRYCWDESQGYFIFDAAKEQTLRSQGKTLVLGNPARYEREKLFIPEASQSLMAAFVPDLMYSAYGILVGTNEQDAGELKCSCALLNSRIFTFYAIERQILRKGKKATPHVGVKGLNDMPVPCIERDDSRRVISKVDHILAITNSKDYSKDFNMQEQGRGMMNELDDDLMELYGMDDGEKESIRRATDSLFK